MIEKADGGAKAFVAMRCTRISGLSKAILLAPLTTRTSEKAHDGFVAGKHRGTWFYVDDRDHVSKRFFNGIYDLFNMEIAPSGGGGGPILTVPVK